MKSRDGQVRREPGRVTSLLRVQGKQDGVVSVTGRSGIHPWPYRNSSHTFGLVIFS